MRPSESSLQEAYEAFCEVRAASTRALRTHLAAAGFGDISGDGLLILGMQAANGSAAHELMRRLGITEEMASRALESLILLGHLELRDKPDNPRQPSIVVTERGRAVLAEIKVGLRMDLWTEFPVRPGDIVISAAPKSGMTWTQMICALLIFQTPTLPASLPDLSPWLDAPSTKRRDVYATLAALEHRRFIKTHTPLNDIPIDSRVTYIIIARHPLDAAISLHHHSDLLMDNKAARQSTSGPSIKSPRQWLLDKINEMGTSPHGGYSYLEKLLKNLCSAWECRAEKNIVLLHYEDLSADLEGEMRRLADRLDIIVPETKWPGLVKAATFKQMRSTANQLQPLRHEPRRDASKEHGAFFRRGASGDGLSLLTSSEAAHYYARAAQVAPPELLSWLHRESEPLRNPG